MCILLGACGFEGASSLSTTPDGTPSTEPPDASIDAPPQPLANAPIAYWRFDVDGRDHLAAHDGVLTGTAAVTTGGRGVRGEALLLTADGDRVDITAPMDFDFNADFTWHIYFKSADGSGALFSRNPRAMQWNQGSKAMFVRSDNVSWDTGWEGFRRVDVPVADDIWHQVIARYVAATDRLDIFYDAEPGAVSGQLSTGHDVNKYDEHEEHFPEGRADTGFSIGAANFTGGLSDLNTLEGMLDEAAVFDVALDGADLDRLIQLGPAGFFPGILEERP